MITVLQIAENIILLSFMGLAYFVVEINRYRLSAITANLLIGLGFGLTAALVTLVPVTLGDGATVDARAGPVILSGILTGPAGAIIAALFGATARGFVGGNFALSGVAVYAVYAVIGLALRHFGVVHKETLASLRSALVIMGSSLVGAASMFFLIQPQERAVRWLQSDLPIILIANSLSIGFLVICIGAVIVYAKKSAELIKLNEALALAKRAGRFGIWDYDIQSGKLAWDDVSKELHGVSTKNFGGTFDDWARNVHPDDLGQSQKTFDEALAGVAGDVFDNEYRVKLPDGGENWVKGDAIILRDANGQATRIVGSNIDLTAIRKTESQLAEAQSVAIQAQKIESVGQLTGGVAHDFNNLLAVIMGNLELLAMKLREEDFSHDEVRGFVEDSLTAAQRGANLTQSMLAYARKAQLNPVALDLNEVVRQTEKWVRRTIESSVEIDMQLASELSPVNADRSSMQSTLINLIVNARDAVGGSGRVTIRTDDVVIDDEFFDSAGEQPTAGQYVMLAVQDDGIGMDEQMLQRIFDPFFTTKAVGQGTGLGLSTVQGFVKQSRGTIRVRSEPGQGTLFQLFFPAIETSAAIVNQTDTPAYETNPGGRATTRILLVEDQANVRAVLKQMLEADGYRVVTAASGDEAFDLFMTDSDFNLVLTDIVMPGRRQGPALVKTLSERDPQLRFIFITGYNNQSDSEDDVFMRDITRLMKPVSQVQLLDAVRRSLYRKDG